MAGDVNKVNAVPSFDREGYQVFPDVLDAEQVAEIRKAVERELGDDWHLEETFHKCPEVAALLTHKPFIDALKSIFGKDFIFIPEQTALGDYHGPWHRDTDAGEQAGHTFCSESDFRQGTAVIYLQDNHPTYAGGLDLRPYDPYPTLGEPISVPTKAGDLLVFDTRLEHKATTPTETGPLKRGIYFTISANNAHAKSYRDFLESRGGTYGYLSSDYRYPNEVQRVADREGLTLMA